MICWLGFNDILAILSGAFFLVVVCEPWVVWYETIAQTFKAEMVFAFLRILIIVATSWWDLLKIHGSSSTRRWLIKRWNQVDNFFLLMINHLLEMFNICVVFLLINQHFRIKILHIWFQLFDLVILPIWNIKSLFNSFNENNRLRIRKIPKDFQIWFVDFVHDGYLNLLALFALMIRSVDFCKTSFEYWSILSLFCFFFGWNNYIWTLSKTKRLFI